MPLDPRSSPDPASLKALDKAALRTLMRARRRVLCSDRGPAAAAALAAQVDSLPVTRWSATTVAVYQAAGSELDPAPLARRLAEKGARIALPAVIDRDAPLVFRAVHLGEPLTPDAMGIPAPPAVAEVVRPDLVLVPLVAFDPYGGRLGQGGGYYDRTLEQLRATGDVLAVGVAFAGQAAPRLALAPHDQRLDGVLTEEGYRAALSFS